MILQGDLGGGWQTQCVCVRLPGLVLGVRGIYQAGLLLCQDYEGVALGTGTRATEEGLLGLLAPRPLFGSSRRKRGLDVGVRLRKRESEQEKKADLLGNGFELLIPSAKAIRIEGRDCRPTLPKCPRRIHDITVLTCLSTCRKTYKIFIGP
jgi:hypothetical protein